MLDIDDVDDYFKIIRENFIKGNYLVCISDLESLAIEINDMKKEKEGEEERGYFDEDDIYEKQKEKKAGI